MQWPPTGGETMKTHWHRLFDQAARLIRSPWLGALALTLMITLAAPLLRAVASTQGSKAATVSGGNSIDTGKLAKDAFERFKRLDGKWTGRSTKGWQEAITFKTIAQGSVVHESSFDAHPNETMATMYYLDGERLLLTHY